MKNLVQRSKMRRSNQTNKKSNENNHGLLFLKTTFSQVNQAIQVPIEDLASWRLGLQDRLQFSIAVNPWLSLCLTSASRCILAPFFKSHPPWLQPTLVPRPGAVYCQIGLVGSTQFPAQLGPKENHLHPFMTSQYSFG